MPYYSTKYNVMHVSYTCSLINIILYCALCSRSFQNVKLKLYFCWYLIILLPLRFYVKSNFGEFKRSKNVIFGNFRGSEFWFLVNLSNFQVPNLPKFKVQSLWNCQKWHFWTIWIHQNLISCKIRVSVKWSNFNKVKP